MKQGCFFLCLLMFCALSASVWSEPKDGSYLHYKLSFSYTSNAGMEVLASVKVPDGGFSWYLAFPHEALPEAFWTLTMPAVIAGGLSINALSGLIYNPGGMSVLPGTGTLPAFSGECLSSINGLVLGKDAGLFVLFDEGEHAEITPWSAGLWFQKRLGNTVLLKSISMYGAHEGSLSDSWFRSGKTASFWTAFQLSAANGGFKAFVQESVRRGSDNSLGWLVRAYTGFSDTRLSLFVSLALSNSLYYTPRLLNEPLSDFSAKIRVSPSDALALEAWTESTQKDIGKSPVAKSGITLRHRGIAGEATIGAEEHRENDGILYIVRGTLGWNCIMAGILGDEPSCLNLGLSALTVKLTTYCRFGDAGCEEFRLTAVLGIYGAFTCLLTANPIWEKNSCELLLKQELSVEIAGTVLKGLIAEALYTEGEAPELIQYGITLTVKQ